MTLTITATAGAANANAYCTLAEANTYHTEQRLHSETFWNAQSEDLKNRAIVWATRTLDEMLDYEGYKASDAQALRWPRTSVYTIDGDEVDYESIPQFLKNATAEFAYHLLVGDRTEETNRDLKGFKYMRIGDLAMVIDPYTGKPVIPPSVMNILAGYATRLSNKRSLVRI